MQIPLAAGRDITAQDAEDSQLVALVNQAFADRYWPQQSPLGKRIVTDISDKTFVVVGVTSNPSLTKPSADPGPFLYLPLYQLYRPAVTVHGVSRAILWRWQKRLVRPFTISNSDLPLYDVTSLKSAIQISTVGTRVAGTFVGAFGLLALVLAAVGIYGLISYTTRRRTRELAIRLALGAEPRQVLRLVLGQGLRLAGIGIFIGLVLAILLTRLLKNLLFGVRSTDALTYSVVAL